MNTYFYRVDSRTGLLSVEDGLFRARRWTPSKNISHWQLLSEQDTLDEYHGLYRICFFTQEHIAKELAQSYSTQRNTCLVTRFPVSHYFFSAFTHDWDEYFKSGIAKIFWIKELLTSTNCLFSDIGMPIQDIEVFVENIWRNWDYFLQREDS